MSFFLGPNEYSIDIEGMNTTLGCNEGGAKSVGGARSGAWEEQEGEDEQEGQGAWEGQEKQETNEHSITKAGLGASHKRRNG